MGYAIYNWRVTKQLDILYKEQRVEEILENHSFGPSGKRDPEMFEGKASSNLCNLAIQCNFSDVYDVEKMFISST